MGFNLFSKATNGNKAAGPPGERILAELKSSRVKSWDAQVAVVESLAELKDAKDVELCQPAVRPLLKLLKAEQPERCQKAAALAIQNLTASCTASVAFLAKSKWQRKAVFRLMCITASGAPSTQATAAKALQSIAALGDNARLQIALSGAPKILVSILSNDDGETDGRLKAGRQEAAARCLREIAVNPSACRLLDGSDVHAALSALLTSEHTDPVQEAAAWALCTIACSPDQQARLMAPDGGIQELVCLIRDGSPAADAAVWVLHNLCAARDNVPSLVEGGAIEVMVDALSNRGDLAREAAARTLSNCAWYSAEYARKVVAAGALPPLLHVLSCGTKYSKTGAAMAVCQVALWEENIGALLEHRHEITHQLSRLLAASTQPTVSGVHSTSLQEVAASALQNMAASPSLRRVILDEPSLVGRLVALLSTGTAIAAVEAAGALANLCALSFVSSDTDGRHDATERSADVKNNDGSDTDASMVIVADAVAAIVSASGEHYLVRMMDEPAYTASAAAAAIRGLLVSSNEGCQAVVRAGCVQAMVTALHRMHQLVAVAKSSAVEPDVWSTVEYSAGALADLLLQTDHGSSISSAAAPLVKLLVPEAPAAATREVCRAVAAIAQRSDAQRSKLARRGSKAIPRLAGVLPRRLVGAKARAAAADALAAIASDGNPARAAIAGSIEVLSSLVSMVGPDAAAIERTAGANALSELARSPRLNASLLAAGAESALEEMCELGSDTEREIAGVALDLLHRNAAADDIALPSFGESESITFWKADVDLNASCDDGTQHALLSSLSAPRQNQNTRRGYVLLRHGITYQRTNGSPFKCLRPRRGRPAAQC